MHHFNVNTPYIYIYIYTIESDLLLWNYNLFGMIPILFTVSTKICGDYLLLLSRTLWKYLRLFKRFMRPKHFHIIFLFTLSLGSMERTAILPCIIPQLLNAYFLPFLTARVEIKTYCFYSLTVASSNCFEKGG